MLDTEELSRMEKVYVKVYETRTRLKRMTRMKNDGVGFSRIENFLEDMTRQKKVEKKQGYMEEKIVSSIMSVKIRDERKLLNILMKKKEEVDRKLIEAYGRETRKHQRQKKHLGWIGQSAKRNLDEKYDKKIRHLMKKHRTEERKKERGKIKTKWREKHPTLDVYKELEDDQLTTTMTTRTEDDVYKVGNFSLNKDEIAFLQYPPKTTLERTFNMDVFQEDSQQMGCKLRWEEERALRHNRDLLMDLPESEVGMKKYEDLDAEEKENILMKETRERQIYDRKTNTINLSKFRATDSKVNAHITLPAPLPVDKEALINLRINAFNNIARDYYERDTENGLSTMNLPAEALDGKESIERRVKKKELVMLQTDKSGKMVPTEYDSYIRMGEEHTRKDRLITRAEAHRLHREQDNHSSQLMKCFNLGGSANHTKRLRESYLGGNGIAPMNV